MSAASLHMSVSTDSDIYVRSQCCAEIRKGVSYVVDVKFHSDGTVVECQCECAAGIGPTAHCKHVRSVLFAVNDFITHKT